MESSFCEPLWETDETRIFRNSVRRFVEAEFAPVQDEWRKRKGPGAEAWKKAGSAGLLLADVPMDYGGGGGNFANEIIVCEELANAGGSAPMVFGAGDCGVLKYRFPGSAVWLGTTTSDSAARAQVAEANAKLVEMDRGKPGREWIVWTAYNQGRPVRFAAITADVQATRAQKLCDIYRAAGRFCVVKPASEIVSPEAQFNVQPAAAR